MSLTLWLNSSLQFLIKLVQSDMIIFITLAVAMMALYGVVTIIIHLVCFFKR